MYMRDIKVINIMEYVNLLYIVGAGGKFIYLNVHAEFIVINMIECFDLSFIVGAGGNLI